jgi:transposase-like protein
MACCSVLFISPIISEFGWRLRCTGPRSREPNPLVAVSAIRLRSLAGLSLVGRKRCAGHTLLARGWVGDGRAWRAIDTSIVMSIVTSYAYAAAPDGGAERTGAAAEVVGRDQDRDCRGGVGRRRVVSHVARRHDVMPLQLFGWMRQFRDAALASIAPPPSPMFAPAVVDVPVAMPSPASPSAEPPAETVRIRGAVDAKTLAAVLKALA